jgi:hypothetical protein
LEEKWKITHEPGSGRFWGLRERESYELKEFRKK